MSLVESLEYAAQVNRAVDFEATRPPMAYRDQLMAWHSVLVLPTVHPLRRTD